MSSDRAGLLWQAFPEIFPTELTVGCQDGWLKLLLNLGAALKRNQAYDPAPLPAITRIMQEKGILTIGFHGGSQSARKLIRQAEESSRTICELDGRPAVGLYVCAPHWFRHLCRRCAELHGCMTIDDRANHERDVPYGFCSCNPRHGPTPCSKEKYDDDTSQRSHLPQTRINQSSCRCQEALAVPSCRNRYRRIRRRTVDVCPEA